MMRSKLTLGAAVVILVTSLSVGASLAIFTDEALNVDNNFTAGTVDIEADRGLGEPIPGPMFYTTAEEGITPYGVLPLLPTGLWWPGRSVERTLIVRNEGSLLVRIDRLLAEITEFNGEEINGEDQLPQLAIVFAQNMHVEIHVAGHDEQKELFEGTLYELLTIQEADHKPLIAPHIPPPGPPHIALVHRVTMLPTAGNELQGIVPVVSFKVFAEQTANNP